MVRIGLPFIGAVRVGEELISLLLIVLIVVVVIKLLGRGGSRPAPPPAEEAEALRRLCAQLDKMERRLDNLEVIVMDKDKKERQ